MAFFDGGYILWVTKYLLSGVQAPSIRPVSFYFVNKNNGDLDLNCIQHTPEILCQFQISTSAPPEFTGKSPEFGWFENNAP